MFPRPMADGHPRPRNHWSISRLPGRAAPAQVRSSQGQPCSYAHLSISKWPLTRSCTGARVSTPLEPFASAHCIAPKRPRLAALAMPSPVRGQPKPCAQASRAAEHHIARGLLRIPSGAWNRADNSPNLQVANRKDVQTSAKASASLSSSSSTTSRSPGRLSVICTRCKEQKGELKL